MDKILVINCGSSSFKCKLFSIKDLSELCTGSVDRIGQKVSTIKINNSVIHWKEDRHVDNHNIAIQYVLDQMQYLDLIIDVDEIKAVGHRVVAGGEYFKHAVIVNKDVIKRIDELSDFAPMHNPINLMGIKIIEKLIPNALSVAVFGTAYHQTLPKKNYLYGIPYEWYEKYKVRKYGAHGISHSYLAYQTAKLLNKKQSSIKMISCHLGAGSSICAIKNGLSFDVSMGFTPLTGTLMATRSGSVDVSLVGFMMKKLNITMDEMLKILNEQSGFWGISGISPDVREVELASEKGDKRAQLAVDLYCDDVMKYISQYIVELEGIDAITFSAGIGENSSKIREKIINSLGYLGIKLDEKKNQCKGVCQKISSSDSKIDVFVVPTNEEYMIARDTKKLLIKGDIIS